MILGGGITGQIIAHYTEDTIITDSVPEKYTGPFYLYDRPVVRNLLNELNVSFDENEIRVGYEYNGKLYEEPTKRMRTEYSKKTRGEVKNTALSSDFKALDMSFSTLITRLEEQNHIIKTEVTTADVSAKTLNNAIDYNRLIVTIPAKQFLDIERRKYKTARFLKSKTVSLKRMPKNIEVLDEYRKFDYVYVIDENDATARYSSKDGWQELLGTHGEIVKNPGKIIGGHPPDLTTEDVFWAGRWGQWKDGWKAHDTIRRWKDGGPF